MALIAVGLFDDDYKWLLGIGLYVLGEIGAKISNYHVHRNLLYLVNENLEDKISKTGLESKVD